VLPPSGVNRSWTFAVCVRQFADRDACTAVVNDFTLGLDCCKLGGSSPGRISRHHYARHARRYLFEPLKSFPLRATS
jgi:hypothetical protein